MEAQKNPQPSLSLQKKDPTRTLDTNRLALPSQTSLKGMLSTSWRASLHPKVFSSLLESPLVQSSIGICKNSWCQFTGNKAERHWVPAGGGGSYENPSVWTMPGSTDKWASFLGPQSPGLQNRECHTRVTWDHVCEEVSSEPGCMYGRNWFCCWRCYSCYYKGDIIKGTFLHWVLFWFPTTFIWGFLHFIHSWFHWFY